MSRACWARAGKTRGRAKQNGKTRFPRRIYPGAGWGRQPEKMLGREGASCHPIHCQCRKFPSPKEPDPTNFRLARNDLTM